MKWNDGRSAADPEQLLAIYLNDHRAGATGGEALAERCASANEDNAVGRYLSTEFIPQLRDDLELLERVRRQFGVRPNRLKQAAARVGEIVGRAKLNGTLATYSPLSRVIELEALATAVSGKRQLWSSLATLTSAEPNVFEQRMAVAVEQTTRLQALHRTAVVDAFGPELDATIGDGAGNGERTDDETG